MINIMDTIHVLGNMHGVQNNSRSSLSFELPLSFEQAAAYRKANGQYVRKNQWRDTTDVYKRQLVSLVQRESDFAVQSICSSIQRESLHSVR